MFYYLSKIVWFFVTPSNLIVGVILLGVSLGLGLRWRRFGVRMALASTVVLLAFGLLPLSNYLLRPLEDRFPPFHDEGQSVAGIILLGGTVDSSQTLSRGMLSFNESADRILDTIKLAHRYPQARILISGGDGLLFDRGGAEAPITAGYLASIGIDRSRMIIEDRSRTTSENATYARALVSVSRGERWLLVTSAFHMPRAVGAFRKADFPVTAYPVGYRTRRKMSDEGFGGSVSAGLGRLDIAVKEWIGLFAYYIAGRTNELLAAPESLKADHIGQQDS